ncbi:MAG: hypothetical protein ABGX07_01680, partial [Pirellulaceae bacterium]
MRDQFVDGRAVSCELMSSDGRLKSLLMLLVGEVEFDLIAQRRYVIGVGPKSLSGDLTQMRDLLER